ncbi:MAG: beta-Ala-His dipeptidase [Mycoplasmataceae bacterium]|nr:beta-Ala-His dipeptidase [Mycoplasmataceae bacterium]
MNIKNLKPAAVWEYFYNICQIPHVSLSTHQIVDYLKEELERLGYSPYVDKANNIFVRKPAYKGYEKAPVVLLQGHTDMVGSKDPTSQHDFFRDPIKTLITDGWVHAKKTTLGADNGIAIAIIMAIFADRSLKHGPLEALLTSDEEIGMVGIQAFDIKKIQAKYMINLDNENDQEICIGCPGNIDVETELFFKRETKSKPHTTNLRIEVKGGIGGHSGQTIGQKRVNAIKEIFNILNFIRAECPISLIKIDRSGVAKNNIPYECAAQINVNEADVPKIKKIIDHEFEMIRQEYSLEKDIQIICNPSPIKVLPMSAKDSDLIIGVYAGVPNGVHSFNWKYNVPETSSNLGLMETRKNSVWAKFMVRSSYDQAQMRYANRIKFLFNSVGGKATQTAFVSGWLPRENDLANIYQKFYKKTFKKDAKQVLINGGVEPAFVLSKKPEMLGISIGPLMEEVHTKNERLNIESTQKIYKLLVSFLASLKA